MKSVAVVETLEIAKHDERGRRIAGVGERSALVAAYEASGMTQKAFAEREGINVFTLATWLRKKRQDPAAAAPARAPRFVQVARPRKACGGLEVVFPDGTILRGQDAKELASLVKELR